MRGGIKGCTGLVGPHAGVNGMSDLIVKTGVHFGRDSSIEGLDSTLSRCASASPPIAVVATPVAKGHQESTENSEAHHSQPIRVALIDALQLSRDSLSRAFHALNQGLDLIPFASVEECVGAERADFDVVLHCNHDDGAFEKGTLRHVKALRERFGEVPVVVL